MYDLGKYASEAWRRLRKKEARYYVVHLDIEIIKMSRVGRVQQKPKSQVSMICPTNYKISLFKLPF